MKRKACIVPRAQDVARRQAELTVIHMSPEEKSAAIQSVRHLSKINAIRQLMQDLGLDLLVAKRLVDESPVLSRTGATAATTPWDRRS